MTSRAAAVLTTLAVLIAAPILAGCVGTAAAATAMETRTNADAAAERWDAGAQLAQVVGLEGSLDLVGIAAAMSGASSDYGSEYDRASTDDAVGDGRAEVWGYRYVASGKDKAYVVVVDREGNIVRESEETRGSDFATAIGEWAIDSDRALGIAKEANKGITNGLSSENFAIVSILRQDPGQTNPVWLIAGGGGSLNGAGGGFVELDAVTGAVLKNEGDFMTAQDWMNAYRNG